MARLLVILGVALPVAGLAVSLLPSLGQNGAVMVVHARVAEDGGWLPSDITAQAGDTITLRLTSDDVAHGFALGRSEMQAVEVLPGQYSQVVLRFDDAGRYTYYCTRWCGPGHWRMRGTIDVRGGEAFEAAAPEPLYAQLGLDLDALHPAPASPERRPSAAAGEELGVEVPVELSGRAYYETHSPYEAFASLRAEGSLSGLVDEEIWDLVAMLWRRSTTPQAIGEGRRLFAQNCAACHGEGGRGDGVMAASVPGADEGGGPADFTSAESMMGASPALLHGKILRGGMGTGMPYFGPIFTDQQLWSLVDYLWTFTMEVEQ